MHHFLLTFMNDECPFFIFFDIYRIFKISFNIYRICEKAILKIRLMGYSFKTSKPYAVHVYMDIPFTFPKIKDTPG